MSRIKEYLNEADSFDKMMDKVLKAGVVMPKKPEVKTWNDYYTEEDKKEMISISKDVVALEKKIDAIKKQFISKHPGMDFGKKMQYLFNRPEFLKFRQDNPHASDLLGIGGI